MKSMNAAEGEMREISLNILTLLLFCWSYSRTDSFFTGGGVLYSRPNGWGWGGRVCDKGRIEVFLYNSSQYASSEIEHQPIRTLPWQLCPWTCIFNAQVGLDKGCYVLTFDPAASCFLPLPSMMKSVMSDKFRYYLQESTFAAWRSWYKDTYQECNLPPLAKNNMHSKSQKKPPATRPRTQVARQNATIKKKKVKVCRKVEECNTCSYRACCIICNCQHWKCSSS